MPANLINRTLHRKRKTRNLSIPGWRSRRDSNPRAVSAATRFPIVLVMTSSILLHQHAAVTTAWIIISVFSSMSSLIFHCFYFSFFSFFGLFCPISQQPKRLRGEQKQSKQVWHGKQSAEQINDLPYRLQVCNSPRHDKTRKRNEV